MSVKTLLLSLILSTAVMTQNNGTIDPEFDPSQWTTKSTPYVLNFSGRSLPTFKTTLNETTDDSTDLIDPGFNGPDFGNVSIDPAWSIEPMPSLPPPPWESGSERGSKGTDGFSIVIILFIVLASIGITIFVIYIIVDIYRRSKQNTEDRERYIIEKHRELDRVGNPKTPHKDKSKSKSQSMRSQSEKV